jgi:ABC-type hemin transport system ATPase subunit
MTNERSRPQITSVLVKMTEPSQREARVLMLRGLVANMDFSELAQHQKMRASGQRAPLAIRVTSRCLPSASMGESADCKKN